VLVHPPNVYDFRKRPTLWGPVSDLIPSTSVFDMYPIGFSTIAEYLERKGIRVQIVNIAVRMLQDSQFNVERFIENLHATAFGVDLHWLPHAHGALEIARIIKRYHPETPVILGGLSSSYFHREIMKLAQVDFVLRGDSTEEPLFRLVESIDGGSKESELERIPNLCWKDRRGEVRMNPVSHMPDDLDTVLIDHSFAVRSVVRDLNFSNYLPFSKWAKYPITAALTCRGCTMNCTICGGSRHSYRQFYGRERVAFRDPELLAQDLRNISRYSRGPVFVVGDIRQAGMAYARKFLRAIQGIESQVIFEFFWRIDREFVEEIAGAVPRFVVQVSPESHDPAVLKLSNKAFNADTIESSVRNILAVGCQRLDLFFMSGMPGQTYSSVLESIAYCERLLRYFEGDPRLRCFISPLAPFLDPGSLAYEYPNFFGYRRFYSTLDEHRRALAGPSWKHVLSYETRWMSRTAIVDSTYHAALQLNSLKAEMGQIEREQFQLIKEQILKAVDLMRRIDYLVALEDEARLSRELLHLKAEIEEVNSSTVCAKEELDLPVAGRVPVKIMRAASMLIGYQMKSIWKKSSTRQEERTILAGP
jgi:B12-binding domain/radical SAM domain protein